MLPAWAIVLIVAGGLLVLLSGAYAWNKWVKNWFNSDKIIPLADWLIIAIKFLVKQFDMVQEELILDILNYVQEAYHAIVNLSELETMEERTEAALAKVYEICEREGLDLEAHPEAINIIETAVAMIMAFWATSNDDGTEVDAKKLK